jgi:hypothetical protein
MEAIATIYGGTVLPMNSSTISAPPLTKSSVKCIYFFTDHFPFHLPEKTRRNVQ